MKTAVEQVYVETHNVGETKRATIKASAKIFKFFADQIYSDKYTAIWRELVANGIDAQLMNGESRPVEVTLPSALEPQATIRDFGCSMDHEFMMSKFMAFTDASTKEHSNDYIGGFGIGSKAPLAYTDQYSIRCFLDGEVRVYSVYKDEEDCPCIAFLSKESTTEPNGVEVSFPVRQDDIHRFNGVVVNTLMYFKPQPILKNTQLKLPEINYVQEGDGWAIREKSESSKGSKVIVGGVSYNLPNSYQIDYVYENLRNMTSMPIDFRMEIGSVNISLSRESITFDDDLYKKLDERCSGIKRYIEESLLDAFDDCKTLWEARIKKGALKEGAPTFIQRILNKASYDGLTFAESIGRPDFGSFQVICYGSWDWNDKYKSPENFKRTVAARPKFVEWDAYARFYTDSFDMIVIDDKPDIPLRRIIGTIEANPSKKILFVRDNAMAGPNWPKFIKEHLGDPPEGLIHYLSKQTPAAKQKRVANKIGAKRPFKCYVTKYRSGPNRNSSHITSLPTGGGVYIPMDNFFLDGVNREDVQILYDIIKPDNIVWLNKTDLKSSNIEEDSDWTHIKDCVVKFRKTYKSEHKRMAEAQALSDLAHIDIVGEMPELIECSEFPKRGPLAQLGKIYDFHKDCLTMSDDHIRSLLGIDSTKHKERLKKIIDEIQEKYPVLWDFVESYNFHAYKDEKELLNRLF